MNDKDHLLQQLHIDRSPESSRSRNLPRSAIVIGTRILLGLMLLSAMVWYWVASRPLPVQVEMARMTVSDLAQVRGYVLNASGYVTARRQATVSSKFTGKVKEVLVEEGMLVSAGQTLARLDDSNLRRELALVQSQQFAARSRADEAQARLHEAELNVQRIRELAARRLISLSERDAAEAAFQSWSAQLQTRMAEVKTAQQSVALQQQLLDDLIIRAPFAGVVVAKNAQPGEMISPVSAGGGFTRTGICSLVDMHSLEIEVDVSETHIERVSAGQRVEAVLDAYPDWRMPAKVIAVIPTADRQKATVKVRIGFAKLDARILPDMGVKVAFLELAAEQVEKANRAVFVPGSAIHLSSDQQILYVILDGKAARRVVTAVADDQGRYQIVSGLKPGERYVVKIPESLQDGTTVRIQ